MKPTWLGGKNSTQEGGVRTDTPSEFSKGKKKSVPTQRLQYPYKYLNVSELFHPEHTHPPDTRPRGQGGPPSREHPLPYGIRAPASPPELFRLLHHESSSSFSPATWWDIPNSLARSCTAYHGCSGKGDSPVAPGHLPSPSATHRLGKEGNRPAGKGK